MTFINRTAGEVKLFWLDAEGQRQGYGALGPGETRDQHTFAGHVWLVTDGEGKTLAVFEAQEDGGEAFITGERPKGAKVEKKEGARLPPSGTSPDGRWRVFIRDHNVAVTNIETGQETCLSSGGTEEDGYSGRVYWAPDSKTVVVQRTKKGDDRKVYLIESSPEDQVQPKLQSYEYLKPGDRVAVSRPHLFDVAGETRNPH